MHVAAGLVIAAALQLCSQSALPQSLTTSFPYQGELSESASPANGTYDLQFRALSAATGGTQVGPTLCADDVVVENGRFTTSLDFGGIFGGQRLFLEISVRSGATGTCASTAGSTTLSPRQEKTATPYATYAVSAAQASTLGGQPRSFFQNASNLTTGTISNARLSSNIVRFSSTGVFAQGTSVGASGVTLVDGGQIPTASFRLVNGVPTLLSDTAEPVPDQGLSLATAAAPSALFIEPDGDIGIGTLAPAARLHVAGNVRIDGTITHQPVLKSIVLPASAFVPSNSTMAYVLTPPLASTIRPTNTTVSGVFFAPVSLPAGAHITELAVSVINTSLSAFTVELVQQEFGSIAPFIVATVPLSGAVQGVQTASQPLSIVVPDNTAYFARLGLQGFSSASGTTQELASVRLSYTIATPEREHFRYETM
jgi:hypothetical protein